MRSAFIRCFVSGLLILCSMASYAQRNNIRFLGFCIDNIMGSRTGSFSTYSEDLSNKTAYLAGYERTIGQRLQVGIGFEYHLSYRQYLGESNFKGTETGRIARANYIDDGYGLFYESKYYFKPFEEQAKGIYVSVTVGYAPFTEKLTEVYMNDGTYPYNYSTIPHADIENNYSITRYGLKIGGNVAAATNFDVFFGLNYNRMKGQNDLFETPSLVNNISFTTGFAWGIPF